MSKHYIISPQTYDDQFWWKKDDIQFWQNLAQKFNIKNLKVLELAAGTGRLAVPIILSGYDYTGLEISSKYVKYANKKLHSNVVVEGDMRSFNLKKSFNMIFIGFNSFLHLLSFDDINKCFQCIKKHMDHNTRLYIDFFMPHESMLSRNPEKYEQVLEYYDSKIKDTITIKESLKYIESEEVVDVLWFYFNSMGKCVKTFNFKMKIIYPDTFHRLVEEFGFCIKNLWGSYDMSLFDEYSQHQIYEITI